MDNGMGLIHIYHGDGKGKTTAAMGLAVRALGQGLSVMVTQFLKDGSSGEVSLIKAMAEKNKLPVTVLCDGLSGFTKSMTDEDKKKLAERQQVMLEGIFDKCRADEFDLLILDELLHTINMGFLEENTVLHLLKNKPKKLEVVITGRNPTSGMLECADYITEMKKIKHPYDKGIAARMGIEL